MSAWRWTKAWPALLLAALLIACSQPRLAAPPEPRGTALTPPDAVRVLEWESGLCLDVPRGTADPGTSPILYPCHGETNQQFAVHAASGDDGAPALLRNLASELCLSASGTSVTQAACEPRAAQLFRLEPAAEDRIRLVGADGACLVGAARAEAVRAAACGEAGGSWRLAPPAAPEPGAPEPPDPADPDAPEPAPPAPDPQPSAPESPEVVPINWGRFGAAPDSSAALQLREALLNGNRYLLTSWWREVKGFAAQPGPYLDFGGNDEHDIRHPAAAAEALAISLGLGAYDEAATGVSRAEARRVALSLVRSLAYRHRATSADGWGLEWQSALWAHKVGLAAWLLWDELTSEERATVRAMLELEAERLVGYPVPYYRDAGGTVLTPGDTKAEENAWNASLLHLASVMMPRHPHRDAWVYKNLELKLSAFARPADLTSTARLHGRALRDWLAGSNAYDDGLLVNHGIVHPDYMATVEHQLEGALVSALAGEAAPEAAYWNAARTYAALVDRRFTAGARHPDTSAPFAAPGGTIYQPGRAALYYPQGNDWGSERVIPYVLLDALAEALGMDALAATPASTWGALHTGKLLEQQARHDDGHAYASASEDRYKGREEMVADFTALAYLAEWLAARGGFARENAPVPVVLDNRDREVTLLGRWTRRLEGQDAADAMGLDARAAAAEAASEAGEAATARFAPRLEPGRYEVSAWWPCGVEEAGEARFTVLRGGSSPTADPVAAELVVDQGASCGAWQPLGTFAFGGAEDAVEVRPQAGAALADALRFARE